jgi:hypothetical protein
MSTKGDGLKNALGEVRKAYRVLYAYQKRALDISAEVAVSLQLQFFFSWYYPHLAPKPNKTPFDASAWDFLPLVDFSVFFSNSGNGYFSRKGDWMLEIRVISDSAYTEAWDLSKVGPLEISTEDADSYVMIYGWIRTQRGTGKWMDVHEAGDWPEAGKLVLMDGAKAYGHRFEFADLADPASLKTALSKLTATLRKKLGLRLKV